MKLILATALLLSFHVPLQRMPHPTQSQATPKISFEIAVQNVSVTVTMDNPIFRVARPNTLFLRAERHLYQRPNTQTIRRTLSRICFLLFPQFNSTQTESGNRSRIRIGPHIQSAQHFPRLRRLISQTKHNQPRLHFFRRQQIETTRLPA